ncbi:MAG TPA: sugar phosphate isomerase/epimerase family protein [Planctomycetaceae bacterium]|nr:sugar phosphate isomerase/epimerase family protein [Planctomycetaceae bacterium]
MSRISMNEMTTYRWSLLDDVAGFKAAGISGIGVWRQKLSDFGEERGIELLRESGLAVSSFSSAGGFTGSDGLTFREAVDDALDAVRLAAEIRAGCLVVVSGGRAGHTFNHARRILRDALRAVGDAAAHYGLSVALQPAMGRPIERWSFLTSLDATLEMLAWCDHAHVGMVCDIFHLARETDLLRKVAQAVPWIKIAAICDAHQPAQSDADRCLPGEGQLPCAEIIAALEIEGYRGFYDVQLFGERFWNADYAALLGECRGALTRLAPHIFAARAGACADTPHADNAAARNPASLGAGGAVIATPAAPQR